MEVLREQLQRHTLDELREGSMDEKPDDVVLCGDVEKNLVTLARKYPNWSFAQVKSEAIQAARHFLIVNNVRIPNRAERRRQAREKAHS